MADVASRELRNNTRSVLERVEAGERITITVEGRRIAELRPVGARPRWIGRAAFSERILLRQADAGLEADLRLLAGELTDDLR